MTDAYGGGCSAFGRNNVVLFGHTKVDELNLVVVAALHEVSRLDVEVVHALAVHVGQCASGFFDVADSLRLVDDPAALHHVGKRFSVDVFHHVVGRPVLFEHVEDADDVGVIQLEDGAGFLDELRLEALHYLAVAVGGNGDVTGLFVAVAVFLEEEFLDGHVSFKHGVLGQVGYSEAALSEYADDSVFPVLQRGAGL